MEIGKFQPPTKSIPLNRSTKYSAQLIMSDSVIYSDIALVISLCIIIIIIIIIIMSARGPPVPNLVEIHPLGASGQMGEI